MIEVGFLVLLLVNGGDSVFKLVVGVKMSSLFFLVVYFDSNSLVVKGSVEQICYVCQLVYILDNSCS